MIRDWFGQDGPLPAGLPSCAPETPRSGRAGADRWGGRSASTAPPDGGDPSGRATLLPGPRMHHLPGSRDCDGEVEFEADDRGRADRAWANHPAAALDESGADMVMSDITRQDRWRLRSGVHIRVSPLCS